MMRTQTFRACLVGASMTLIVSAQAGIIGVSDSRVQGFFSTQNGGFFLSDPLGQGFVAPPAGMAAIAGANGVDWVPFTFPNSRVYNGIDNAPAGQRTSTFTAIVGGFVIANSANINSTFIAVPQTSFLLQEAGAVGVAFTQLNFSIDYTVNAAGVAGGNQRAQFRAFGRVLAGGYARFQSHFNYWDVATGNFLGGLNLDTGVINAAGNFNVPLQDNQFVNGIAGAGTVRINGWAKWEGDPMEISVETVPEPSGFAAAALGLAFLRRKKRTRTR